MAISDIFRNVPGLLGKYNLSENAPYRLNPEGVNGPTGPEGLNQVQAKYQEAPRIAMSADAASRAVGNPVVGQPPAVNPDMTAAPAKLAYAPSIAEPPSSPRRPPTLAEIDAAYNKYNQQKNLAGMQAQGWGRGGPEKTVSERKALAPMAPYALADAEMQLKESLEPGYAERYQQWRHQQALEMQQVAGQGDLAKTQLTEQGKNTRQQNTIEMQKARLAWDQQKQQALGNLKKEEWKQQFALLQQKYTNDLALSDADIKAAKEKLAIQHANDLDILQRSQEYQKGEAEKDRADKHIQMAATSNEERDAVQAFLNAAKDEKNLTEQEKAFLPLMSQKEMADSGKRFLPKDYMLKEIERLKGLKWATDKKTGEKVYMENGKFYNPDGSESK